MFQANWPSDPGYGHPPSVRTGHIGTLRLGRPRVTRRTESSTGSAVMPVTREVTRSSRRLPTCRRTNIEQVTNFSMSARSRALIGLAAVLTVVYFVVPSSTAAEAIPGPGAGDRRRRDRGRCRRDSSRRASGRGSLIALSMGLLAGANLVWAVLFFRGDDTFPSASDALHLVSAVALVVGLSIVSRDPETDARRARRDRGGDRGDRRRARRLARCGRAVPLGRATRSRRPDLGGARADARGSVGCDGFPDGDQVAVPLGSTDVDDDRRRRCSSSPTCCAPSRSFASTTAPAASWRH